MKKIINFLISAIVTLAMLIDFGDYLYGLGGEFINSEAKVIAFTGISAIILFIILYFIVIPKVISIILEILSNIENKLKVKTLKELLMEMLGIIIGLVIANLISAVFHKYTFFGTIIVFMLNIVFAYLGYKVASHKKDDIINFEGMKPLRMTEVSGKDKILDTSVIIDGRILDILKTGFIEGKIIIPQFVLDELRHIADSSDTLKRNRGRRGLDILNEIQKQLQVVVEITDKDYVDILEVDSKLLKLAEEINAAVVTNDFNLNKVADFQGVIVLNINELSNAVKPAVLPGEEMEVSIIKDGKEQDQGIGYLNDGTMIVVEGGKKVIGRNMNVLVTSVLQTAAGRMIFAKVK